MGYLIYPQEWEGEIGVRVTGRRDGVNQKDPSLVRTSKKGTFSFKKEELFEIL